MKISGENKASCNYYLIYNAPEFDKEYIGIYLHSSRTALHTKNGKYRGVQELREHTLTSLYRETEIKWNTVET